MLTKPSMKNYNIYAGQRGKMIYLYTTQKNNLLEAVDVARQEVQLEYELTNGTKSYEEAEEIIRDKHRNEQVPEEEIKREAYELFDSWRDSWGEYTAILTEDDNIANDDLILDYED
jgi:hypothetical protein